VGGAWRGRRKAGAYGYQAHADEPWSLQAYQKRVYAVRDTYATGLKGTSLDNPAWDDTVSGVLGALSRLVGKKPLHVPQVREGAAEWQSGCATAAADARRCCCVCATVACTTAAQALTTKQLAALAGAVDPKNPTLLATGAYALKNGVHGNRAETDLYLDWCEVVPHVGAHGKVDGVITEVGQTKVRACAAYARHRALSAWLVPRVAGGWAAAR
jgi:hypothetical protein